MKTNTKDANKTSAAKNLILEEKVRKSLHQLQPAATDKENLVGGGRTLRSSISKGDINKNEMSSEKIKNEIKKKKTSVSKEKSVQTGRDHTKVQINKEDLTSEAGPSENYWEVLAERRRIALAEALEQNKEYAERISILEDENRTYKEQLDECRALIDVLKDMLGEDNNDINNSVEDE